MRDGPILPAIPGFEVLESACRSRPRNVQLVERLLGSSHGTHGHVLHYDGPCRDPVARAGLARSYPDALVVAHEPVGYDYSPKTYLRADHRLDELRSRHRVGTHLDEIHRVLEHRSYVEVGFPAFALAPLLQREYGPQLRLVQLVRHPAFVAASLVTHDWYQSVRNDTLHIDVELEPSDPGVLQKHYGDRWPKMSAYEKCLFYWTEVHLFGLEIHARLSEVPFCCLRYEDVTTSEQSMAELASFIGVPHRKTWEKFRATRVDAYVRRTRQNIDTRPTRRHLQTMALADRFGYTIKDTESNALRRRYVIPKPPLAKRAQHKLLGIARTLGRNLAH